MATRGGRSAADQLADYEAQNSKRPMYADKPRETQLKCGASMAKKTLLGMNLLFLFLGAVLVGVGVYTINARTSSVGAKAAPLGVVTLGVIVMAMSLVGCMGAMMQNRVVLLFYMLVMVLSIVVQIIIAAFVLADSDGVEGYLEEKWLEAENDVRVDIQNEFDCCGLYEFNVTAGFPCPVCLDGGNNTCPPCFPKIKSDIHSKLQTLGILAFFIAFSQILGVWLANCLRKGISEAMRGDDESKT